MGPIKTALAYLDRHRWIPGLVKIAISLYAIYLIVTIFGPVNPWLAAVAVYGWIALIFGDIAWMLHFKLVKQNVR